jgi:hypothetical protein
MPPASGRSGDDGQAGYSLPAGYGGTRRRDDNRTAVLCSLFRKGDLPIFVQYGSYGIVTILCYKLQLALRDGHVRDR